MWKAADGTTTAWKGALVAEWQKQTKKKDVTPRLDALLSSKPTAALRASLARGAKPDQVAEPQGWLATRDSFKLPDFRLPVGH